MTQPKPVDDFTTDIARIARARHTAKSYKADDLTPTQIADLLDLLRFSSSSVNIQPWHVIVATTDAGRDRVAKAGMDENFPFNSDAVRHSGLTAVFAARLEADEAYLSHLMEVEDRDGRFLDPEKKSEWEGIRKTFVDLSRDGSGSAHQWMARQTYWNGGQFLLGAAAMGLDATPMEGVDIGGLDREFGLGEKGYTSLFAITVGRNNDAEDWNFGLPKSRLPLDEITTRI